MHCCTVIDPRPCASISCCADARVAVNPRTQLRNSANERSIECVRVIVVHPSNDAAPQSMRRCVRFDSHGGSVLYRSSHIIYVHATRGTSR